MSGGFSRRSFLAGAAAVAIAPALPAAEPASVLDFETYSRTSLTLADYCRNDANLTAAYYRAVEHLNQSNNIMQDLPWKEA